MPHRVLDFSSHAARNGHATGGANGPPRETRVRDWDVDVGSLFVDERGGGARRAQAGFRVRVDPVRCGYSVTVYRDGIGYDSMRLREAAKGKVGVN